MGQSLLAVTGLTFILVDGTAMLAEKYLRARFEAGKQVERAAWIQWREKLADWEKRREDAREQDQPFTEPRPEPPA